MAFWDALLNIGGQLGGAFLSSNANQNAAETVANSNRDAANIYANAQREGLAAYREMVDKAIAEATAYNQRAQGTLRGMAAESQPAVDYLRGVAFSNPYDLTPQQRTAREGTMRSATATVAASGLRGAGRAGVAAINKAGQDFDNSAWASNRSRADSANSQLFGENQTARLRDASLDQTTGATRASMMGAQGQAAMNTADNIGNYTANTTRDTGQTGANADLASANNWGSAIGALTSIFANEAKQRGGNYAQYNPGAV